ncbi:MAG: hypothetical protein WDM80_05210 [Limisphaerales bacterium]
MFAKLQFYILGGCILAAAVVFSVCEFWQKTPLQEVASSASPSSTDAGNAQDQPANEEATNPAFEEELQPQSPSSVAQVDVSDDKVIGAVMEKLEHDFLANDYSYTFEVMYASILESVGGREKGIEAAQAIKAQMKEQQMAFTSWKARKPYHYITGESHKYAIIPYEMEMTVAGKKLRSTGYQLGIKMPDSKWQFVSGDKLTSEIFEEFFPDFPKTVELPKAQTIYE